MKRIAIVLLGLWLGCLWTGPAAAQSGPPVASVAPGLVPLSVTEGRGQTFTRLSTTDGLSQTRVAQIVQDAQGFVWLGTQYGLNRYDGYDFRTFVHDPRRPGSIGAVFVTALFLDRDNMLWIGGARTLDRMDPLSEKVEPITLRPGAPADEVPTVVHISQDRAGAIWLATGAGLFRRDPATGETRVYLSDPAVPDSLSGNDIRFSGEDREGAFWVGTTQGLDRLDRDTGRVTLHVPLHDPVQVAFFEDRAGRFWVLGASGNGLARLDRATGVLTRYSFYDTPLGPNDLTGVMGMVEDEAGRLWIGSPGKGLMQFDPEAGRLVHFAASSADPVTIAEDRVIGLFRDREGNIWAQHHAAPPSHFNPRGRLFESFRHRDGDPDSLKTDFVNAMFEDDDGILWIGNDFGLTRIDRRTGRYTRFRDGLSGKPMVITITQDRNGAIWVGTYGNGMARLDEATGRFESFTHDPGDPSSLASNQVHRLFVTRDGTLWAATHDGLSRLDDDSGRFTTFKANPADSLAQVYVSAAEDADGTLWLGTHFSGLHRFDPRAGGITIYSADPDVPGSLRDNMVPTVRIGRDGIIWVGTQSGLDRLDPATGTFTAIHESPTAPDRTISHILEDKFGTLWIGTNRGLMQYNSETGAIVDYLTIIGLDGNDFTGWATGYQSARGEMFLGGFSGGIAFFPEALSNPRSAMPIVLTDIAFPFASATADAGPQRAAGATQALTLDYAENGFSLRFAAPSFVNPRATRYRYRLEGLEENWREVDSTQRVATYTTLPPGTYVFHAQAASARAGWSEPGITLPIRIDPPWWATWWFRAALGLGLAGLVVLAFRIRTAQIEQREREFRKLAENAPDMVMRFDCDLRLFYANSAARAFIGPAADQVIGSAPEALARIAHLLPVRLDAVREVRDGGAPSSAEFRMDRDTGPLDIDTRIVPETTDAEAQTSGSILVIARDITGRKATEAALRRAEADLAHAQRVATVGELTASIAHEVNQPLTGIVTNGEAGYRWLNASPPNLAEVGQSIERIVADGRRAAGIIARIAALVRKSDPEKRPVDLNATIREAVTIADAEIRRWTVTARFDLAPDPLWILGDRVQVQQVVLNLIGNALEAMSQEPEGERVLTVATRASGGRTVATVADTGPGIAPDAQERIFDTFYSTKPGGMGMGLAISRSVVASHNGRIRVTPNTPRGSRFEVDLPLLSQGPLLAQPPDAAGARAVAAGG